jgi:hypothetical protein
MWGNPNFQQFGWQPPFLIQFMPQMMQGNQMQFQHGFPTQQYPMFAEMQGGSKPGGTQVTAKVQSQDDSHSGSTPVIQDKVKKPFFAGNGLTFDQNFKDVICYNCGEPCHYVGMCPRPKKILHMWQSNASHGQVSRVV